MPFPSPSLSARPGPWPRRASRLLAAATLLLLLVGGLVTTYRVGMAVHDWPTTFGHNMFSYPLDEMLENFGVTVEHTHRLLASLVGLLTIVALLACAARGGRWAISWVLLGIALEVACVGVVLAQKDLTGPWPAALAAGMAVALIASLARGRWRGLRALAVLTHLAVIGQGLLGGTRVLENSQHLAFLHGSAAQVFYALVAALVVVTSRAWEDGGSAQPPRALPAVRGLRAPALIASISVLAQIVLGAWLRHSGRMDALWLHAGLALGVAGAVLVLAARLRARADGHPVLARVRRWLLAALGAQVALGLLATLSILVVGTGFTGHVTLAEAVSATLHVAGGALLLASSVAALLWSVRLAPRARAAERAPLAPEPDAEWNGGLA